MDVISVNGGAESQAVETPGCEECNESLGNKVLQKTYRVTGWEQSGTFLQFEAPVRGVAVELAGTGTALNQRILCGRRAKMRAPV
jgi:hypothetical protein